jgi:hypothetical protein
LDNFGWFSFPSFFFFFPGASDFDTSHYESAYAVIGFMIDNYQMLFGFLTAVDGNVYRYVGNGRNSCFVIMLDQSIYCVCSSSNCCNAQKSSVVKKFKQGNCGKSAKMDFICAQRFIQDKSAKRCYCEGTACQASCISRKTGAIPRFVFRPPFFFFLKFHLNFFSGCWLFCCN